MTSTDWKDFDPNQHIPFGLKNARTRPLPDGVDYANPYDDINGQEDTFSDEDSELNEDEIEDDLDVPDSFTIVSQTLRTGLDGNQVVDVVIEISDVEDAVKYEVRVTR